MNKSLKLYWIYGFDIQRATAVLWPETDTCITILTTSQGFVWDTQALVFIHKTNIYSFFLASPICHVGFDKISATCGIYASFKHE